MTSLANILIGAPAVPSPAGDVLWRNADLEQLDYVGIIPTTGLLDELLTFKSGGDAGTTLGRLVPGRHNVARSVTHPSANIRLGAVKNRETTSVELTTLTADSDPQVAAAADTELTRRNDLVAQALASETKAIVAILDETLPEAIGRLLDTDPRLVAIGCQGVDTAVLLGRLGVIDPDLRDRVAVAVLDEAHAPISTAIARWACSENPLAQALLPGLVASKNQLRRRLTPGAEHTFIQAGHLAAVVPPASPVKYTALDDMALILETAEIAAMYFSSSSSVSPELHERIMQEAPVQLVVNHLIGGTPRKPHAGSVRDLLEKASPERRLEIAQALEKAEAEKVLERVSWGGELLLGFRRVGVVKLDIESITNLFAAIDAALASNDLAWEYLMALSEEWEATIIDLIDSAANMEGIQTSPQTIVSA
jgi:hypothetical protein